MDTEIFLAKKQLFFPLTTVIIVWVMLHLLQQKKARLALIRFGIGANRRASYMSCLRNKFNFAMQTDGSLKQDRV